MYGLIGKVKCTPGNRDSLPSVQAAITKARPIIAGFGERFETQPVGGHGLSAAATPA